MGEADTPTATGGAAVETLRESARAHEGRAADLMNGTGEPVRTGWGVSGA
jgi:hypothetical protein